jgi:PAS domain S-box-containing protein
VPIWWRTPAGIPALVLAVALVGAAYFVFVHAPAEREAAIDQISRELALRTDTRVLAVARWIEDGSQDVSTVAEYPSAVRLAAEPRPVRRTGEGAPEHLDTVMTSFARTQFVARAFVLNSRRETIGRAAGSGQIDPAFLADAQAAMERNTVLVDVHRHPNGVPGVAFTAPIRSVSGRVVGAVQIEEDPRDWLYPFLEQPPLSLPSSEAVLVRRDGDSITILNPLRLNPAAPLTLRVRAAPGLAALVALGGGSPFGALSDYRGVPVFAAAARIADAPWGLVTKVDRTEVLGPIAHRMRVQALAWAAVFLAVGAAALALWRAQVNRSLARNALVLDQANDAILFLDLGGRIRQANRRAEEFYGYGRGALHGRDALDLQPAEDRSTGARQLERARAGDSVVYEATHLAADGSRVPVEVSSRLVTTDGVPEIVALVRDIRERKVAEERIRRLNRSLRTLSEINQLIVREGDPGQVFAEACRIAVEHGGFRLAWIGEAQPDGAVRLLASAGDASGYLTDFRVRWDGTPEGSGPTGMALREGRTVVMNDAEHDQIFGPWRQGAREHGIRSSAACPIRKAGELVGVLNVYADLPAVFDGEVVAILEELASDLGFALKSIDDHNERTRAEAALRRSERDLVEAQRIGSLGSYVTDFVAGFWTSSEMLDNIFGIDAAYERSVAGWLALVHPEDRDSMAAYLQDLLARRGFFEREYRIVRASDGQVRWVSGRGELAWGDDGVPVRMSGTIQDVTERHQAEDAVRSLNERLEERVQLRTAELEDANKELEAFAYSVSHDLRAPLRAVDGFTRILHDEYGSRLDDEGRRLLDVVHGSTHRMGRLIDDLLALSKVGRHGLHRSRVGMRDLAAEVWREVAAGAGPRVEFRLATLPDSVGDGGLLRQVWTNLLANALKFSVPKKAPAVEVGAHEEERRTVYFVRDNGVGFDLRYADKLFGVFQRLHSGDEFEGTGVGLALVQRIIHRHGGAVWAESVLGEGATFYFSLPRERSDG